MADLTQFPAEIPAGLPFSAKLDLAEFPAPAWQLTAYLRGPKTIDLAAAADGTGHQFTAPAATTTAWPPGLYWFTVRAAKGADVREVTKGQLRILPDLVTAVDGFDGRTENEKALDAINAVIKGRASKDQESYKINNRELVRMPVADLLKLRSFYVTQVKREKNQAAGRTTFGRAIHVRFKG